MNEHIEKLQELCFPVFEEEVLFETLNHSSEHEGLVPAKGYKAIVGYTKPFTVLRQDKTLFSIVSSSYRLIRNEEFFIPLYYAIQDYATVDTIKIDHHKGYFFVEYMLEDVVSNVGKLGILAINSYDGTASTQLNMFVKVVNGTRSTNLFLDFSFKHKHTRGNNYKEQVKVLRNKVGITDRLNTLFSELHRAEISREDFVKLSHRVNLPKMYQDMILGSLYYSQDNVSCLSLYMGFSTIIEDMELIRRINFLNNMLRGIRSMKKEIHILEI